MKQCYKCGEEWKGDTQPGYHETCPSCNASLHCCLNCQLHDVTMPNECKSTTTEPIAYRDRDNFCDEFQIIEEKPKATGDRSKKAMDDWKKLFGEE